MQLSNFAIAEEADETVRFLPQPGNEPSSRRLISAVELTIDHLLTDKLYEDAFAAVPDIGWPDSFNSGLFVFKPDHQVFNDLEKLAQDPNASFDGKILIFCFK